MDSRQDGTSAAKSWLPNWLRGSSEVESTDNGQTTPTERTSLIPKPHGDEEAIDVPDGDEPVTRRVLHEFWVLLKGSVPVILAYTLQNSLQTISVLIVGRLSPEALATASFAYMFAMATAWLIALGGTTAIDTLASVSFTGSQNPHDLGVILQRSLIVLGVFYIPVCVLWGFSEPVFNALGQEAYIARDASKFLIILIPGGLGYIYFEALKKYLQAQGERRQSFG